MTRRLYTAEQRERELEQRLSKMALRVKDVVKHLGQFQRVVQEEMMATDAMEAEATLTDAMESTVDSLRDADLLANDRTEGDATAAATVGI